MSTVPLMILDRAVISCTPEAAGRIFMRPGPGMTMSASNFSPRITCDRLNCGVRPSRTSRLPKPRSASKTSTFFPKRHRVKPRLATMLVLPTPPLPLVMAMILGPGRLGSFDIIGRGCEAEAFRASSLMILEDVSLVFMGRITCCWPCGSWPDVLWVWRQ